MHVVPCNQPTFFDVDDTLVMIVPDDVTGPETLKIFDTKGQFFINTIPHQVHIQALKQHRGRGHTIVVWSAGGHEWAANVVRALRLEEHVDLVIEKPRWYYDDLAAADFMGKNVWKPNL